MARDEDSIALRTEHDPVTSRVGTAPDPAGAVDARSCGYRLLDSGPPEVTMLPWPYHRLMSMIAPEVERSLSESFVPGEAALTAAAALFRSLGDPSRLAILSHLRSGEHRVVELTDHLGLAQSTVSAHLRCLLDCGLVELRPVGRASVYSVSVEPEVLAVLVAAERLLAATGDAVVLCPVYGTGARGSRKAQP